MSAAKPHKKNKHRNVATKGVVRMDDDNGGGGGDSEDGKSKGGCLRPLGIVLLWFFGIVLAVFLTLKMVSWMDDIRFRMMDAKDVPVRYQKMRDNGQIMDAYKLLQVRPEEETPQIVAMLMEDIDSLEAPFLFVIAERMYEEKPEEALFWAIAGRMRMEYDVNRCAGAQGVREIYKLYLRILLSEELHEAATDETQTRPLIRRVLEWDEEHPPGYEPGYICMILTRNPQVIGEARWPAIRYRLRQAAENYLRETADQDEQSAPDDRGDAQDDGEDMQQDMDVQEPVTPDPDVPTADPAPDDIGPDDDGADDGADEDASDGDRPE